MNKGMLWFDGSKTELQDKVIKASVYFEKKYERKPNLCLVHPSELVGKSIAVDGITVRPYRPVLQGHLWIGIEEE